MNTIKSKAVFRPDIQGLRALAVIFVVLYHAGIDFFSGGYVGVDIFFVISGYLITSILIREMESTENINFLRFYARRMRRLLPAATVVILSCVVLAFVLLSPLEQREFAPSVFFTTLYASNLWFAFESTDYLAGDVHNNPLLHTWSLSVEEQFYLIWPLLLLLVFRLGRLKNLRMRMSVMMIVIIITSFVSSIFVINNEQAWAFFGSPFRAWEFAIGGLLYLLTTQLTVKSALKNDLILITGLVTISSAVLIFNDQTTFPGYAALVPAIGTALIILSGTGAQGRVSSLFSLPGVQTLGNLSYSWYLWHWPAIVFPTILINDLSLSSRLFCVLVSLILAWLTYTFVENPIRFNRILSSSTIKSILFGLLLLVIGVGSAFTLSAIAKSSLNSPEQSELLNIRKDLPIVYKDKCHSPFTAVNIKECAYGDKLSNKTILLFGDSHAAQWFPALETISTEQKYKLLSHTKSACPAWDMTVYNPILGRAYNECDIWRHNVFKLIEKVKPEMIIIGNSHKYVNSSPHSINNSQWSIGMKKTLNTLAKTGVKVITIRDTPWPGFDIPTCVSRALWRNQDSSVCDFSRLSSTDTLVYKVEKSVVQQFENTNIADLTSSICDDTTCKATINNKITYRDVNHLTTNAVKYITPSLKAIILDTMEQ